MQITRRGALALMAAAGQGFAADKPEPAIIRRHDRAVEQMLAAQITDAASRGYGVVPRLGSDGKDIGIYAAGSAAGLIEAFTAAYLQPESRFHGDALLVQRIRLAANFLSRAQHANGLVDYHDTNFDSPPDTAFTVWSLATAACLAQRRGERTLLALYERFLRKAGSALARGGVHTPNHRWVVSSALAQIHELFPDPAYIRRIDQWLAEGIDIDADGQYTERSTSVYNPICDRALLVMALKLRRPELLEPVRRNLEAMLYLLHSNFEVVTEISRRQDRNVRADMSGYWFPLRYFAVKDGNGQFAALAGKYQESAASLSVLMEYPELTGALPAFVPPPSDYVREMNELGVVRFRRGLVSSSLIAGDPAFFSTRGRGLTVQAVRFASAFFGKGQFSAPQIQKRNDQYILEQVLEAGYYQPLDPPELVAAGTWERLREKRRQTEKCSLRQRVELSEAPAGFRVNFVAEGTADVPVAVEISLRDEGRLEGCEPAGPNVQLLSAGYARYSDGQESVRFGPGLAQHRWTQIRGALPKLPGTSVYLTGFTPFRHTLEFEWR